MKCQAEQNAKRKLFFRPPTQSQDHGILEAGENLVCTRSKVTFVVSLECLSRPEWILELVVGDRHSKPFVLMSRSDMYATSLLRLISSQGCMHCPFAPFAGALLTGTLPVVSASPGSIIMKGRLQLFATTFARIQTPFQEMVPCHRRTFQALSRQIPQVKTIL